MFARLMGLKTISPEDLQQLAARREHLSVIDVNSRQSWMKAHVPGAVHFDPAEFKESDLPTDKNGTLVFYCSNPFCMKAPNAARRAAKLGYGDVRVMSAGISGWLAKSLPTEAGV
jgi:rhodanese-related sulfurtransferase